MRPAREMLRRGPFGVAQVIASSRPSGWQLAHARPSLEMRGVAGHVEEDAAERADTGSGLTARRWQGAIRATACGRCSGVLVDEIGGGARRAEREHVDDALELRPDHCPVAAVVDDDPGRPRGDVPSPPEGAGRARGERVVGHDVVGPEAADEEGLPLRVIGRGARQQALLLASGRPSSRGARQERRYEDLARSSGRGPRCRDLGAVLACAPTVAARALVRIARVDEHLRHEHATASLGMRDLRQREALAARAFRVSAERGAEDARGVVAELAGPGRALESHLVEVGRRRDHLTQLEIDDAHLPSDRLGDERPRAVVRHDHRPAAHAAHRHLPLPPPCWALRVVAGERSAPGRGDDDRRIVGRDPATPRLGVGRHGAARRHRPARVGPPRTSRLCLSRRVTTTRPSARNIIWAGFPARGVRAMSFRASTSTT